MNTRTSNNFAPHWWSSVPNDKVPGCDAILSSQIPSIRDPQVLQPVGRRLLKPSMTSWGREELHTRMAYLDLFFHSYLLRRDVGAINRLAASARVTATFYIPNSIKPICHSSYGVEMQIKSLIIWEDANCLFHPPPIANWLRWGTFVAPYWKFEDFHLPGFKGINWMGPHGTAGTEIPIRTLLYWFWITYNYHNLQKLILSSLCYPRRNCPPRHL